MTIRPRVPLHGPDMMIARVTNEVVRREGREDLRRRLAREATPSKDMLPDVMPQMSRSAKSEPTEAQKQQLTRLKKATEQVEAIFLKDLLGKMRRTVGSNKESDPMGEMARDMMDQAVADDISRTNSVGVGSLLFKSLSDAYLRQQQANNEEGNGT